MIIKYNRRAVCMGDDVNNGIYMISLPDNALLKDLINVLLNGGCGNSWPIPQMSEIGWDIYFDMGKIATVSADKSHIEYINYFESTPLSSINISWVFGEREGNNPDITILSKHFC